MRSVIVNLAQHGEAIAQLIGLARDARRGEPSVFLFFFTQSRKGVKTQSFFFASLRMFFLAPSRKIVGFTTVTKLSGLINADTELLYQSIKKNFC